MISNTSATHRGFKDNLYSVFSVLTEWSLIILMVALTFSIALSEICIVVALVSWLIRKALDRDISFIRNPIYLALTAYVAFIGLSVANSEYFYISFRGMIKAVKGIIIFLMVIDTFRTREQIGKLFKVIVILFLFTSFNGIWQYWFGKDLLRGREVGYFNEDFSRRITASFAHYSQLGSYLVLTNSLFLALFFGKNTLGKREKILLAILITLGSVMLFYTGSRSSWIALAFSTLFIGVVFRNKIILGGLLIVGILTPFVLPDYMLIHFDANRKEQSISERVILWKRAVDVIKAHPFLGSGINTYNRVNAKYDTIKDSRVKGYYAHNGYLQLAAEIGLFGLGFFLLFLFLFFSQILWKIRSVPIANYANVSLGFLAGCFGFLVLVIFDTNLQSFQPNALFWIFMGLAMAVLRLGISSQVDTVKKGGLLS